mmetsp:Transcript_20834/g.38943  ORF Transcript_20834/g.38943 Transcript_20834/m.38943 type:complete len:354 (-) Transcript_20834:608-1669(-)
MRAVERVEQRLVVGLTRHEAVLLEHAEEAARLLRDEVDDGLVVFELDDGAVNTLLLVSLLLEDEDDLVELLLELLIGVVNAQLLEAVGLEDLKSEDVQNANEGIRRLFLRRGVRLVDLVDNVLEEHAIDVLHQCPGVVARLALVERYRSDGSAGRNAAVLSHSNDELAHLHTEKPGDALDAELALLEARLNPVGPVSLGLELDVSELQETGKNFEEVLLFCYGYAEGLHGLAGLRKFRGVVNTSDRQRLALVEHLVKFCGEQVELGFFLLRQAAGHLVEDVIVPLALRNIHEAGFLQQKVVSLRADNGVLGVILHLDVLSEAGAVVVPDGLGVSKGLQDHVRLHQTGLDAGVS